MTRPEPVWRLRALLGEAPIWLPNERALRFVDTKLGRLHRYEPEADRTETLQVGGRPSFIVPDNRGGLLVGSGSAIHPLHGERLGPPIATVRQPETNRTNDATVDPLGRLWFGTMDDHEERASGAIWCMERGAIRRAGGKAIVTNGPATSGDGRFVYFADSTRRKVWRFEIGDRPILERGREFVAFTNDEGCPDGLVVDSEDCLWVALWDGWAVRRYCPEGRLIQQIEFPCARVTKLAFGGDDLRTAYVTTARAGLNETALEAQPLAGSLFAFNAPVAGRPPHHTVL